MQTVTQILIDVSSSMQGKIEYAKQLLLEEIIPTLDYSSKIGIQTFMSQNKTPQILSIVPIEITRSEVLINAVKSIIHTSGNTPIAASIKKAVDILAAYPMFDKRIILVTDGEETDGGDYEAEAKSAKERNIDCQIHIIGIGLNDVQMAKAKSISSHTNGTASNVPFSVGKTYVSDEVKPRISAFTQSLGKTKNPAYTGPTPSINISANPSNTGTTLSHPAPSTSAPTASHTPLATQNETLKGSTEPSSIMDGNEEQKILTNSDTETSKPVTEVGTDDTNLTEGHPIEETTSSGQTDSSARIDSNNFAAITTLIDTLKQQVQDLPAQMQALKMEFHKERIGEMELPELSREEVERGEVLVSNLLKKRYADRVSKKNDDSGLTFEVVFEDGGPIEYYVLCKSALDANGTFSVTKEDWRLFLNHTKNTQIYLVMPSGSPHEYYLIDNLLDWVLRGKIVPYLHEDRVWKADTIYFSFSA